MILLWYVTQEPQTHHVQERYTATCKYYSYRNLPMYSKLEQKTTQTSYIQIQVVISVGWVLETGTDPQRLSGRFLRFIPTLFKKSIKDMVVVYNRGSHFLLNFFFQITSQKTVCSFLLLS